MKWRSSIKPEIMKKTLFKGSLLAFFGILLIFSSSAFMFKSISFLGFVIFSSGLGFITWGLLPYKKLSQRELFPDMLQLESKQLVYHQKSRPTLLVPLDIIQQCDYVESKLSYGISIQLMHPTTSKIKILNPQFNLKNFLLNSPAPGALFFPYFSKFSYCELKEEMALNTSLNDIVHFD